jgi:signal transduction histidine kinase
VLRRRDAERFQTDLISMFSHDLMTPLGNIIGYATLLVDGDGQAPERRSAHTSRILYNAHYMHELLDSILTTIRIDAGKLVLHAARVDLCDVVRRAIDRNGFLARDRFIQVEPQIPAAPLELTADASKLNQILNNLLTNAINAAPDHSRVTIGAAPHDDGVRLWVRDEGRGIAPEDHERIFRKFAQASPTPASRSTGLGLFIVDQLTRLHGGSVCVDSALGRGSTFTVTLPRASHAGTPCQFGT